MVPRDGIGYYNADGRFVDTWTNLETGDFVTVNGTYKERTLHATIDAHGIVTALSSGPGTATVYDCEGDKLAHQARLFVPSRWARPINSAWSHPCRSVP